MEPQEHVATVRAVEDVGPDTVAIELETPEGFLAYPGQFVLVRATVDGEDVARHYTLSSPEVGESFEVTVGVDPEGDLSPWLADRAAGDELTIEGPFGNVFYDEGGDVVCLAGGPGVGPALAIAERAVAAGQSATIVYEDESPAHEARLAALADGGASVTVVTPGGDSLAAAVGAAIDDGQLYVFGFTPFIDAVEAAVTEAGGDFSAAEVESFG